MEREAFLERVRRGLSGVQAPSLPGELPSTPASDDGRPLPQRFSEELRAVGGVVELVSPDDLTGAVAAAAAEADARTAVIGPDLGSFAGPVADGLNRSHIEVLDPDGAEEWREACARADLGVTGALVGVASSGSILTAAGTESSRLASLLPPGHLVVLPVERLIAGFEELFASLPGHLEGASSAVLLTGPSRTADIEMVLVRGVHGPRDVHVLLVEEPGRARQSKGPAPAPGRPPRRPTGRRTEGSSPLQ
jgi:L-lactate dehydrogenase complex protein LldG